MSTNNQEEKNKSIILKSVYKTAEDEYLAVMDISKPLSEGDFYVLPGRPDFEIIFDNMRCYIKKINGIYYHQDGLCPDLLVIYKSLTDSKGVRALSLCDFEETVFSNVPLEITAEILKEFGMIIGLITSNEADLLSELSDLLNSNMDYVDVKYNDEGYPFDYDDAFKLTDQATKGLLTKYHASWWLPDGPSKYAKIKFQWSF